MHGDGQGCANHAERRCDWSVKPGSLALSTPLLPPTRQRAHSSPAHACIPNPSPLAQVFKPTGWEALLMKVVGGVMLLVAVAGEQPCMRGPSGACCAVPDTNVCEAQPSAD